MSVRAIQLKLLSGGVVSATRQYNSKFLVENAKKLAEKIIEVAGDDADIVADFVRGEAVVILTTQSYPWGDYLQRVIDMIGLVDAQEEKAKAEAKAAEPPAPKSDGADVTAGKVDLGQPTLTTKAPKAKMSQPKQEPQEEAKTDVAISDLGLDAEVVEKLLDAGVGTKSQLAKYAESNGLDKLLGDDAALKVLEAIDAKAK